MTLNANLQNAMQPIADATARGAVVYANPKGPIIKALEREGLIEGNASMPDPGDAAKIAYRATVKGLAECPAAAPAAAQPSWPAGGQPAAPAAPGEASADTIHRGPAAPPPSPVKRGPRGPNVVPVIHTGGRSRMALPPAATVARKRGPRGEKYGFGTLAAPNAEGLDNLFVQATEAMPNPEKTLASNINKANKKVWPAPETSRKFVAVAGTDPITGHPGATVFRTA